MSDIQVFKKDVQAQGPMNTTLLNNRNLGTQYLTTNTEQTLLESLILGEVATAQVDVGGNVNSWRLREEVTATMKVNNHYISLALFFTVEETALRRKRSVKRRKNVIRSSSERVRVYSINRMRGISKFPFKE